jgi:hypothetical protein
MRLPMEEVSGKIIAAHAHVDTDMEMFRMFGPRLDLLGHNTDTLLGPARDAIRRLFSRWSSICAVPDCRALRPVSPRGHRPRVG